MSQDHSTPDRAGQEKLISVTMVIALGFVAIGIPLQCSREWVALGWMTFGCVLWFHCCRLRDKTLTVMSLIFMAASSLAFVVTDFSELLRYEFREIASWRPEFGDSSWPALLFAGVLMLTGVATRRMQRNERRNENKKRNQREHETENQSGTRSAGEIGFPGVDERVAFTRMLGVFGLWIFLVFSSFEIIHYFGDRRGIPHWREYCVSAVSSYWVIFATVVHVVGLMGRSDTIRLNANLLYVFLAIKTILADVWGKPRDTGAFRSLSERLHETDGLRRLYEFLRPDDWNVVWNTYAFPLLFVALTMIAASVFALRGTRYHGCTFGKDSEKVPYTALGLFGFSMVLLVLSIECYFFFDLREQTIPEGLYLAHCSLTYLWTTFGLLALLIGVRTRSSALRGAGLVVFLVIAIKSLALDFHTRPESYTRPILNPFALSVLYLVAAMLAWAVRENLGAKTVPSEAPPQDAPPRNGDRDAATGIGLFGLALLWLVLSLELFLYVNLEENRFVQSRYLAVSQLSFLWTVLGLAVYGTGIANRSFKLRAFGMIVLFVAGLKTCFFDMPYRPEVYFTPIWNPFAMPALSVVASLFFVGFQSSRSRIVTSGEERQSGRLLGGFGIVLLLALLSIELYRYFKDRGETYPEAEFLAIASLSVLWVLVGATTFSIGVLRKSPSLRLCGTGIFVATALKTLVLDFVERPESYTVPFYNAFAIPTLLLAAALMFVGVLSCRILPEKKAETKTLFVAVGLLGLALFWGLSSVEIANAFLLQREMIPPVREYYANLSVTLVWVLFSGVLLSAAFFSRSEVLRYTGVLLSVLVMMKSAGRDVFHRPDFHDVFRQGNVTPFFNSYMLPLLVVSVYLIVLGIAGQTRIKTLLRAWNENAGSDPSPEKPSRKPKLWIREKYNVEMQLYRIFAYAGTVILLLASSIECFRSYDTKLFPERIQNAQMALSILWAVFGGTLLFVGFRWKSMLLRWCSILLLGVTTVKVFVVDLSGVDSLYKVGAFLILALILGLGARAYQRFYPDGRDDGK